MPTFLDVSLEILIFLSLYFFLDKKVAKNQGKMKASSLSGGQ
jgi:hypothetical protein